MRCVPSNSSFSIGEFEAVLLRSGVLLFNSGASIGEELDQYLLDFWCSLETGFGVASVDFF